MVELIPLSSIEPHLLECDINPSPGTTLPTSVCNIFIPNEWSTPVEYQLSWLPASRVLTIGLVERGGLGWFVRAAQIRLNLPEGQLGVRHASFELIATLDGLTLPWEEEIDRDCFCLSANGTAIWARGTVPGYLDLQISPFHASQGCWVSSLRRIRLPIEVSRQRTLGLWLDNTSKRLIIEFSKRGDRICIIMDLV